MGNHEQADSHITLEIDDDTLKLGREYAQKHKVSFNVFVSGPTTLPSSPCWRLAIWPVANLDPIEARRYE